MNKQEAIAFTVVNVSIIILTGTAIWMTGTLWSLLILLFGVSTTSKKENEDE